jgi:hypothetical protein
MYKSHTFILGIDEFGGWKVEERDNKKSNGWTTTWSIPAQYADMLGIINAKIMWLQAFLEHKHPIQNKKSEKGKKDAMTLRLMKDSCARCLIFTYHIRNEFYAEVSGQFYSERGAPMRRFSRNDTEWRSESLDSWIYAEFYSPDHRPATYLRLSKPMTVERHPKDITFEGSLPRSYYQALVTDSNVRLDCLGQESQRRVDFSGISNDTMGSSGQSR